MKGSRETPWCRDHRGRSYTFEEWVARVGEFHGYAAPGVVFGGLMVALAMERIPREVLFDAVCETRNCLPDAVQLLTPCTVGNGWLRFHETGRFALSFFDKETGEGARVHVDAHRLRGWPEADAFFFKRVPKKKQDQDRLLDEFRQAGPDLCRVEKVKVRPQARRKEHLGAVSVCTGCGEGYPLHDGDRCRACQGFRYFDLCTPESR